MFCLALVLSLAAAATAQENAAGEQREQELQQPLGVPLIDANDVPTRGDSNAARRSRDQQAFIAGARGAESRAPAERDRVERQLHEIQQQLQKLDEERDRVHREYQRGMESLKRLLGDDDGRNRGIEDLNQLQERRVDMEAQRAALQTQQQQLQTAAAQLALMAAQRQQEQGGRPVERGTTQIYSLLNSRAFDTAQVLDKILGQTGIQIAVDDRTNSVIVYADEDTVKVAEALALRLDQSARETKKEEARETLQLRIVWLLDGLPDGQGKNPEDFISGSVRQALNALGLAEPQVVAQQVTTLTVDTNSDTDGEFQFEVPVLINDQPWQFGGQGKIRPPVADNRFEVEFALNVHQENNPQHSNLGGSIFTPLGHFTVMGTTTFVRTDWQAPHEVNEAAPLRQHLSAFVIHLDRAREFPAAQDQGAANSP
jgi:hypothetical protein